MVFYVKGLQIDQTKGTFNRGPPTTTRVGRHILIKLTAAWDDMAKMKDERKNPNREVSKAITG